MLLWSRGEVDRERWQGKALGTPHPRTLRETSGHMGLSGDGKAIRAGNRVWRVEMKTVSLRNMDDEVWHQAKVAAMQVRITLSNWIEQAIREKLERGEK